MATWQDNSTSNKYIDEYIDISADDDIIDYGKIRRYRYLISMNAIIDEDKENNIKAENIEIAQNEINDFIIEHDFRNNFYPIIKTTLTLKTYNCKKIQNNKNIIKFRVKFSKYVFKDINSREEQLEEIIFDDYFQPVFLNIMIDTTGEANSKEVTDNSLERRRQLEIYLFNLLHINENKKIINFIANKCTPKNAIGYILNQVNIDRVVMEIPTVTKEYNQILIPPKNFKNAIQTVSEQYGIYSNGFRQYMDFNRYYLLDNTINKRVPVEKNEYPNVYINVVSNTNVGRLTLGSYIDKDNKCYFVNAANNIYANTYGSLEKEVIGNKLRIYERSELENAMTYNEKNKTFTFKKGYIEQQMGSEGYTAKLSSSQVVNEKVTYAYNSNETQTARESMSANTKYGNLEFSLTLIDIDISFLTLNKRYIFKFQDINMAKLYNGIFMIEKMVSGYDCANKTLYSMCKFVRVE